MLALRSRRLDELIPTLKQPVLGICLGMQLLHQGSDERDTDCLGVFPGRARLFTGTSKRRVPHMGWNELRREHDHGLLADINDGDFAYFVHSYALPLSEHTLLSCDYGGRFAAASQRENFYAAQFHPERSAHVGAQLLANFLSL
nr:imidazole glycerol phosphate synthase subunit HisH 2-like [Nerophis lumbriciformis]